MLLAANGLPLPRRGERPQNASVCVCRHAILDCFLGNAHSANFCDTVKQKIFACTLISRNSLIFVNSRKLNARESKKVYVHKYIPW